MNKTAIIGASGYIGSHLLRTYRETFPDCIGTSFSRGGHGLTPFDLRNPDSNRLDLEDTGHEAVLIASAKPNVGWCEANPKESYELNVKGTLDLVTQLAKTSIKIFFLSSDYVFNGECGNYSDEEAPNPNTEYGKQKAEVEREIPNLTKNFTIIRLSKIYGTSFKDGTLLDLMASDLVQGRKQKVASDQIFSPTHVNDVVSMILFVQQHNLNGLINLCHENQYSRYQIGMQLAKALQAPSSLLQEVSLHTIPTMENRPLNTSLRCSPVLQKLQPTLKSMENSITSVAENWGRI